MSRRILVTGATGLIGGELMPVLRSGPDEVISSGRSAADLPGYHRCDLSDPDAARRMVETVQPDAVVHLAGGTASGRHELYRGNVLTTVHLLEAVARLTPRPYCLVFGSAAEYGDASAALLDEASPLRPVTEYGRAKVAQTTLAEEIGRARGIPLTILRPFNIVAPRLPPASALGNMRRQLLASGGRERSVRCGRLDIVRDFVPLADVVEAVRRLLARPAPGRVINVCSGVGIALGEILAALGQSLGVELRIVPDPELAAMPAAPRVVGSPAALREVTGLEIRPTPESLAHLLME
jgi:nucleoside-diphosphate-sugar epimerase